jgi:hypothetical protein
LERADREWEAYPMRTVGEIDTAIKILESQKDLALILEDWDDGLLVQQGLEGQQIVQMLDAAKEKYGQKFGFRAFNQTLDVWWNGDLGVVCEGEAKGNITTIPLESDSKRYPGAKALGNYAKVEVEEITRNERVIFLRFRQLLKGGG